MDANLKQRLTGAVILTSVAIILLPMLLDGTEQDRERITATIPEPPKIDLADISVASVEQQMGQLEKASEARLPREVVDETDYTAADDFILDKNQLPVNWSLQLGSFEKQENATRLRARLRAQNYRSYILHAKTSEGEIFRVFVGPSSSKDALAEMNKAIEASMELTGRIVRYRIEEDKEQLGG